MISEQTLNRSFHLANCCRSVTVYPLHYRKAH